MSYSKKSIGSRKMISPSAKLAVWNCVNYTTSFKWSVCTLRGKWTILLSQKGGLARLLS